MTSDGLPHQVRAKMGLEAFLKNNKGINGGADLPPAYLEALYWAVVNEEIRAHELAPPSAAPTGHGAPSLAAAQHSAQRDGATAAVQHALPPMRSRWRFLRQRRAAAVAAAPPFTRRAQHGAIADETNGPRNGVEGSAAEEEHASCLEVQRDLISLLQHAGAHHGASTSPQVQRDLISHISPVVIELCTALLSGHDGADRYHGQPTVAHDGADRYHGQPTVASPPATSPADWTLAMRTLVRCLTLGVRLGAVTGAPVRAPLAVDRALRMLCDASRLPSMLLHDERLARPLLLAHSARPVILGASALALARAMPSHLGREAWYGLLKIYIVLLHLGLAPFPTDPYGATSPALAAHWAADAAGTAGAAGASSGEVVISGAISGAISAIPVAAADTEAAAAAAAQLAIERLLGAPLPAAGPNPTAPPWEMARGPNPTAPPFIRSQREQEMARGPNPTAPPWEMARGWQPLLHGTVGAGLLTAAVLGAADTSNALLPALMRIVDETMPLALASASLPPHASALSAFAAAQTAATALSLLAHVLDLLGGAAPQWARPAAVQRMQWVVAQPQCPMPVRQAASRGLQRMQGTTSLTAAAGDSNE